MGKFGGIFWVNLGNIKGKLGKTQEKFENIWEQFGNNFGKFGKNHEKFGGNSRTNLGEIWGKLWENSENIRETFREH